MVTGRTDLSALMPLYAILVIALVAIVTDLAKGRIFNWLTLPALACGLVYSLVFGGWSGLGDAALGVVIALALYGPLFWLRAMGGGDVKLLMALGAWGGLRYAVEVAFLAILLGGALAVLMLLFKGKLLDFGRRMYRFLLTLFIKDLELETPKIDRKLTMPFGVPIAIAAMWAAFAEPLRPWVPEWLVSFGGPLWR